ncbi:hypothetical protein BC830DRAFT_1077773 [Chytriomyces sp. MP71]|nr:hypothetical protein BC830DRAFT_1077773 [Chytriomyces sp. MP71]
MSNLTIHVKSSSEAKFSVEVASEASVLQLKEAIAAHFAASATPTPVDAQRVIFAGRVLKDEDSIASYKISDGSTVHLVRSNLPKAAAPSPSAAEPAASSPANPSPAAASAPSTAAAASPLAGNPFAALLGGAGTGAAGLGGGFAAPGLGSAAFGADPAAGMPPGMDQMLNNPQMQASMAALMSNPQFMEMMIASNPQLANMPPEMRAFMQSDAFRRVMSDPNMLRQMMQMAPIMGGGVNPFAAGLGGADGGAANPYAGAGATPMNPTGAGGFDPALMQMLMGGGGGLGGLGGFGSAPLPPPPANPEEAYQVQLRQLQDMGFYDAAENIRALTATRGNVEAAVEWLFANPPPGHR